MSKAPKREAMISLTDDQLKVLSELGLDLKGKELQVGILAGRYPIIRDKTAPVEDIIICVTGC